MLQINTLSRLDLGVKDENLARDLYIDMNAWYTDYPNGSFSIWHKRNGDETKYAASGVTFDRDSGILKWTPDAYDTFYIGKGLAEIRCTENNVIKKTKDIVTEVARSLVLGSGETLAAGWQNFLNAVEDAKNGAEQAQDAAEEAVEHYPYVGENGNWFVWDVTEEEYVDTEYAAQGPKGDKGDTGATGAQGPTGPQGPKGDTGVQGPKGDKGDTGATGAQGPTGAKGDKGDKGDTGEQGPKGDKGDTGATGATGAAGQDGADGEDGYTPVRGTDYWTAEDKAEIVGDVEDDIIDDTAGEGDTGKTWSADKLSEETALEKTLTQAAIQSFEGGAWPMEMQIAVDPVQDLHGYSNQWPGGGGKNKCPTVTDGTYNGIVLTNNSDGSVKLTGTNGSSATYIDLFPGTFDSTAFTGYVFSYGSYSGNTSSVQVRISDSTRTAVQNHNSGETTIANNGTGLYLAIRIAASYAIPSGGITLYPMLRASTDTSDWEPYSNVCHITGWTGAVVNVLGENDNLLAVNDPGYGNYTIGPDGALIYESNRISTGFIPCNGARYATATAFKNPGDATVKFPFAEICAYDSNKHYISRTYINSGTSYFTYELPQGTSYIKFAEQMSAHLGHTATPNDWVTYERVLQFSENPVSEFINLRNCYPITFPTSAGTIYGGTLSVNKDGTGTLVVDRAYYEFDGSEDEPWVVTGTNKYARCAAIQPFQNSGTAITNNLSYNYIASSNTSIGFSLASSGDNNAVRMRYVVSPSLNETAVREWLAENPLQLVHELATPVTYSITPGQVLSLLGQNNVWADTGDILSLTYSKQGLEFIREDTAGQIAEANTVMKAIIAPELDGMVADTALAVNDFRIVNGVLYIVTAPIASGGTLTVGTNVSKTSIGEQITALLNAN